MSYLITIQSTVEYSVCVEFYFLNSTVKNAENNELITLC